RKYDGTDKPHVRITERVISPEELASVGAIELITSSHNHTDHFDPETLQPLLNGNQQAVLALPRANRELALERLGQQFASRLVALDAGESTQIGGIQLDGIASAHPTIERDNAGS